MFLEGLAVATGPIVRAPLLGVVSVAGSADGRRAIRAMTSNRAPKRMRRIEEIRIMFCFLSIPLPRMSRVIKVIG